MKAIKIKLEIIEIESLQSQVLHFINYKSIALQHLDKQSNEFFSDLLAIDTLQRLYYGLRGKVEKSKSVESTLNLTVTEAVIILQLAGFDKLNRSEFQAFVMQKISNEIHKQLINL